VARVSRVRVAIAVGVAAATAAVTAVAVRTGPAGAATTAAQVITVQAPSAGSVQALLEAWQRQPNGVYKRVRATTANIGHGVGAASETSTRTPAGQFTLTEAYGINANPGTTLPYKKVDIYDWWVSDTTSPLYNTYQRCLPQNCPFDTRKGERLGTAGPVYGSFAVIDYNRRPVVRGAGSAFFLHIANGHTTAGCVAVAQVHLVWLLRWLSPASHPIISIGVGAAAYAPIPHRQL
jgi:L,D-peptidoglycan transpeptidase YkuD (ErfK/YbiS/YcfS/YnhG family)